MNETLGRYETSDRLFRPQPPPSFETQLKALPLLCYLSLSRWHCETWKGQSVMSHSTFRLIGG